MSSVGQSEIESDELCKVCGDQADGHHYSILSCRGCNAFFRRAVTFDMKYICRKGGECNINKTGRCTCRACRFNKCVQVGMDKNAVQPKRDSNGQYKNRTQRKRPKKILVTAEANTSNCLNQDNTDSTDCTAFSVTSVAEKTDLTASINSNKPIQYNTDNKLIIQQKSNILLIDELIARYSKQCARRKTMFCTSIQEIFSSHQTNQIVLRRPLLAEDYRMVAQVQMMLMLEWVQKLEQFKQLNDINDKTKLLRAFALKWMMLDNLFLTVELGISDKLIIVNNTYIDPSTGNFARATNDSQDTIQLKNRLFRDSSVRVIEEVLKPMLKFNLTTGEMMALKLIVFWNYNESIGLSESGQKTAKSALEIAILELHSWYIQNNFVDIPVRMGNLLLLLPAFAKMARQLVEDVKIIKTFDMVPWDSFLDDLFTPVA